MLTKYPEQTSHRCYSLLTRSDIYIGIRDQQKITLLQRARAFASESISAKELEEARLGKNTHVLIATQHTVDQFV